MAEKIFIKFKKLERETSLDTDSQPIDSALNDAEKEEELLSINEVLSLDNKELDQMVFKINKKDKRKI
jgi:hypothetical protein